MAKAARIVDAIVVEVVEIPDGAQLEECFHQDAGFVPCPDHIVAGQSYSGSKFGAPAKIANTALKRYFTFAQFMDMFSTDEKNGALNSPDADIRIFLMSLAGIQIFALEGGEIERGWPAWSRRTSSPLSGPRQSFSAAGKGDLA